MGTVLQGTAYLMTQKSGLPPAPDPFRDSVSTCNGDTVHRAKYNHVDELEECQDILHMEKVADGWV